MSRHTGPKLKLSRKVGEDLGLKSNALKAGKRVLVRPGQHGAKMRRKLSDFGTQLKEKQKLRFIYGVTEKQLRKLFAEASKNPTATGDALLGLLERRLDNVVYRSGWAHTRAGARQLVSHAHIQVNGTKMDVPSYQCQVGDVITLSTKATKIPVVAELLKFEREALPAWMSAKQGVAKVMRLPAREEIAETLTMQLVVEYYSR